MKKTLKIILWLLLGLVLLLVAAIAAAPLWMGPLVRSAAVSAVPGLTGCDFKLENASLNPWTGKFRLVGMHLRNPKGYDAEDAVAFDSLFVELDMGTVCTKKIHIREITIENPYVSYVFDAKGSNNFDRILAKVNESTAAEEKKQAQPAAKDEKKGDAPKVVIDKLVINGTKVRYRMLTLPIPLPTLTNIGGGENSEGASAEEVKETVWNSIKDKFTSVGGALGSAASSLGEGATNALKGAANLIGGGDGSKVAEGAKALSNTATDGAKAVGEGVKAVGEGVTGGVKAVGDGAKDIGNKAVDGLKKLNPFGK